VARNKHTAPPRRTDAVANAGRLAREGDVELAIAEYRKLLVVQPDEPVLLSRLAALLERAGAGDQAWQTFVAAADAFEKRGFANKATAIYAQAADLFPHRVDAWKRLALSFGSRKLPADAIKALLKGRDQFKKSAQRAEAIELLAAVINIDPVHVDAVVDCAQLMVRQGERAGAVALLHRLASQVDGRTLRRVRSRLWRISPTPANGMRWLRAALSGR